MQSNCKCDNESFWNCTQIRKYISLSVPFCSSIKHWCNSSSCHIVHWENKSRTNVVPFFLALLRFSYFFCAFFSDFRIFVFIKLQFFFLVDKESLWYFVAYISMIFCPISFQLWFFFVRLFFWTFIYIKKNPK